MFRELSKVHKVTDIVKESSAINRTSSFFHNAISKKEAFMFMSALQDAPPECNPFRQEALRLHLSKGWLSVGVLIPERSRTAAGQ
ncbi:hypothetical protein VSX61_01220 [Brenneria populi subsp. brevivirga]|uniref:hypothetical protein n=1 Tax=Brenneria populi TaxID=1505588 RepID=UPI002E187556|nr:hypothetical protein [Brenneria populi subsp. brevivirga]